MLSLLEASGSECVMVEDSPRNLLPAKAVGMMTILVESETGGERSGTDETFIDFTVRSVLDVEEVIDHLLEADEAEGSGNG
jgi:FMN phosphatase YigB (HAD superfamily)